MRSSPKSRWYSIFGQRFWITVDATRLGPRRGFRILDPDLHPDHLEPGKGRKRLVDDRPHMLRPAEDVDHVDRLGDLRQPPPHGLSEKRLARMSRVDRNHPEALEPEIARHVVARPHRVRRYAHHGDGLDLRSESP
jgi:hypothetical protein